MQEIRFDSQESWLAQMVEDWKEIGSQAIQERGTFLVALSGGSTPEAFYKALAESDWPWSSTHLFIGDERSVPAEHADSNYRMIFKSFYPHNVKLERWTTEANEPAECAADYSKKVEGACGQPARFDLVLLGIGNDGHTASLFPGTEALNEQEKLIVPNWVPQMETQRYTFTYPLIHQSREVWFIAKGEGKQPWIEKMVAGVVDDFPAANVTMEFGTPKIYNCIG